MKCILSICIFQMHNLWNNQYSYNETNGQWKTTFTSNVNDLFINAVYLKYGIVIIHSNNKNGMQCNNSFQRHVFGYYKVLVKALVNVGMLVCFLCPFNIIQST